MKRILYVRSGPYQVNLEGYNSQELGLAEAFSKRNIKCDIVYYHKQKNFDQIVNKKGCEIRILWRKGIKILRSGIYPQLLSKNFLNQYDLIIISEYSQIMAVLLGKLHKNVYIYNGPYYNLFKIPFIEKIYDFLFVNNINKNIKGIFCKTNYAKKYLEQKGLKNCEVIGVGLDTEKFNEEEYAQEETIGIIQKMKKHRNIVYIGSISKRKNVELIVNIFNSIKKRPEFNNVQLVIIGKDDNGYLKYCMNKLDKKFKGNLLYYPYIKNSQLKFIYSNADIFILPSIQEIFGMVLLESMYFRTATISSKSAGATTLIEDGFDGFILNDFELENWENAVVRLLKDKKLRVDVGERAHSKISGFFMWDSIVNKILEKI
ncbi:glycosyltransferase family 4 protein [Enterococcus casseliflavus]|uniref:Glycosyltransferase n=1 Tax=Enterococcus casseliflavus TaxID=37734 RepID=A0ABD6YZA5_ENTCA|nr:glycosyltransferase family 4 protein [Enterococcus casseliflavus]EOH84875.1 hypothetical protein UAM_00540 [Enterococcus casseliflavus ATCC 49996]EOU10614.1 hypothetical protein I582_01127 [Enterococcus casseliflavus ATCC 49996]MBE9878559.1 glycosyltransferase family 4 protein [Enterococcus casseliflavus]QGN29037.1 glycosyltransferase [Enterococcus casseliflavus]QQB84484.1 glycosyltransferase family 4 protein [Enterococcus casseliflavus]